MNVFLRQSTIAFAASIFLGVVALPTAAHENARPAISAGSGCEPNHRNKSLYRRKAEGSLAIARWALQSSSNRLQPVRAQVRQAACVPKIHAQLDRYFNNIRVRIFIAFGAPFFK